jgi:hypothetical protein
MPLMVAMVDVRGKLLSDWVRDTSDFFLTKQLPLDDPSYPYLGFIDLYGETVFNRVQLTQFLKEWKRWSATAHTDEQKLLVKRIEELAVRSQRTAVNLRFSGD